MNQMKHLHEWSEHKARLASKGLINPVFVNLNQFSCEVNRTAVFAFESLLVARHAQRLGELIDRSLAIRRDIRELEVLEVKAATDYDLFNSTSVLDEQIDILRLQMRSKVSDQTGFTNAAAAFTTQSTLEKGLSEISRGRSEALAADLSDSATTRDLIKKRWQSLRDYQNAYHARYTEPGNAHNYGERAQLLLDVLKVLLEEALARAAALADGIEQIYGMSVPDVPTSVDLETVDQFAVWGLRIIRYLSHAAEQESLSEIVIPLVQPWWSQQPLIKQGDFDHALSNAENGKPISLSFQLPKNSFLDPRTRLKSIGVSFGNASAIVPGSGIDRNEIVDNFTRLTLKVTTPAQTRKDGSQYYRPPVLIGNVGLHGTNTRSVVEGNSVENLSPFGVWSIDVHPLVVWKDGSKQLISSPTYSDPVKDLKIFLRFYVPGDPQLFDSADVVEKTNSAH
jgi:hypothetical protein